MKLYVHKFFFIDLVFITSTHTLIHWLKHCKIVVSRYEDFILGLLMYLLNPTKDQSHIALNMISAVTMCYKAFIICLKTLNDL